MQLRYTNIEVWRMACKVAAAPHQQYLEFKQTPGGEEAWLNRPNARASFAFPDQHDLLGEWDNNLNGWARFLPKNGWYMGSNPAGMVKCFYVYTTNPTLDHRKTYLCDAERLLDGKPHMDDIRHDLAEWPADWVWNPMIPDPEPDTQVIDVDVASWREIKLAASESTWIPPEYFMNDWVSDICRFLRKGHPETT